MKTSLPVDKQSTLKTLLAVPMALALAFGFNPGFGMAESVDDPKNPFGYENESQEDYEDMNQENYQNLDDEKSININDLNSEDENQENYRNDDSYDYQDQKDLNYRSIN